MRPPNLKGVQAYITNSMTEEKYHEYPVPEEEGAPLGTNHSASYIEAVVGERFYLSVQVDGDYPYRHDDFSYHLFVNGKRVDKRVATISSHGTRTITVEGPRFREDGQCFQQQMVFVASETTEETDITAHIVDLQAFGEITLEVRRCRKLAGEKTKSKYATAPQLLCHEIPEKALKKLKGSVRSTAVGLVTPDVPSKAGHRHRVRYPGGKEPLATFSWNYRSRRDLEIEGIVERPPTPPPLWERDPEGMSSAELKELVAYQRAMLQSQKDVIKKEAVEERQKSTNPKRGRSENADEDEVLVLASKKSRVTDVVDLTED